ncbi:OmpA family protein [Dokdonia sp.]|uniref:OmpA family protein n=1 Tax=Dokdonia sp. TaxID=2024995 RepID=UPI003265589D
MKYFVFMFLFFPSLLIAQTEIKASLYYDHDAYQLEEKHVQKIDSIKQLLITQDSITIRIQGFANAYGTDRYNVQLSKKRAREVQLLFDTYHILETEGYGALESTSGKNRRVDIFISRFMHTKKETVIIDKEVSDSQEINDLSTLEIGDKIVLKGILFLGGTDTILEESTSVLQELYDYLDTNPKTHINLIGHICCHGSIPSSKDGFNVITKSYSLSKDRAKAIYDYLVDNGISNERLAYEGRAYLEPLGKGSKYDRRVEIEIIE